MKNCCKSNAQAATVSFQNSLAGEVFPVGFIINSSGKPEVIIWAVLEEDYRCGNCRGISSVWSCTLWTCRLQPTSLKSEKKTRCAWQVMQSEEQFGWSFSINVKRLFTNLALAGNPQWTECIFVPVTAAPQSSEPPQYCSTSQATSRIPPTPASKRLCLLQQRQINNTEWRMKWFCFGLQFPIHQKTVVKTPCRTTVLYWYLWSRMQDDMSSHLTCCGAPECRSNGWKTVAQAEST